MGKILYFGADGIANHGDAVIGVWFFQHAVGHNSASGFRLRFTM